MVLAAFLQRLPMLGKGACLDILLGTLLRMTTGAFPEVRFFIPYLIFVYICNFFLIILCRLFNGNASIFNSGKGLAKSHRHTFILVAYNGLLKNSCDFSSLSLFQLRLSTAQTVIKGGYWFCEGGLAVGDMDATLFTHLFCAFADLDSNTNQLVISDSKTAQFSSFTQTVQQKNPSVKTLLSIGGGGSEKSAFSAMASQPNTRKSFVDSSI
ncbi:hypothetical protein L6164_014222 [Bauhinia variegata]|uniref:Uncharacterized protein n=1 Tax=Bauhinia variegata TaxID=167791 RepID=A0ACB9NHC6_BAUVA|nr:hypothetical protein L6164_014222 [Bauhinia variegata]